MDTSVHSVNAENGSKSTEFKLIAQLLRKLITAASETIGNHNGPKDGEIIRNTGRKGCEADDLTLACGDRMPSGFWRKMTSWLRTGRNPNAHLKAVASLGDRNSENYLHRLSSRAVQLCEAQGSTP